MSEQIFKVNMRFSIGFDGVESVSFERKMDLPFNPITALGRGDNLLIYPLVNKYPLQIEGSDFVQESVGFRITFVSWNEEKNEYKVGLSSDLVEKAEDKDLFNQTVKTFEKDSRYTRQS